MKQKTLKSSFTLHGQGLHTGHYIDITFNPAPADHGYKIKRVDLENQPIIDARAENVVNTQRGTVLGQGEATVSTVEHAFAALYAHGITNCLIEVNAPEFPILDGSAIQYVEQIQKVGIQELDADQEVFVVRNKIEVYNSETGSKLTLLPDDNFSINSIIEFESDNFPNQYAILEDLSEFDEHIAASRTFVFVRDLLRLRQAGLIKGGSLDNAIVIYEHKISQEALDDIADVMEVPRVSADNIGYLNEKPLVYPNEPARHKLLDIVGDLALTGVPIQGRIIAIRPGHGINNKLARKVSREIRNKNRAPHYDPNQEPVLDINQIRELLPHRYPILMVDKIIEKKGTSIVGVKNITNNEPFFTGHFPEEPVMPGVLQIEAMAQTGGLLVLSGLDEPERYSTYFLKIDNVKFRNKVVPGDTVIFKVELSSDFRRGIATMRGTAFVGDKVVSEADFTAQVIKNK